MDYTGEGKSNEWYTPPEIFEALNIKFDLDPCSPLPDGQLNIPAFHWCENFYNEEGLEKPWNGVVFMNPPWSGRQNAIRPWLKKFIEHGKGIAIFPSRTSCGWFHEFVPEFDSILFPKGKTKFIPGPGIEIENSSPMAGVCLGAIGGVASKALRHSKLGIYYETYFANYRKW